MSGMLVVTPSESAGVLVVYETSNVSTTRQKVELAQAANAVEINPIAISSSTAIIIDVVINAVSDAAADAALASAGSRVPVPVGKTYRQLISDNQTKITRIDYKARYAETGTNIVVLFAKV